jgi:hypothetical protein
MFGGFVCHPVGYARRESFFRRRYSLNTKKITTKIAFVVDPSESVPEGTTTKLIFMMMGTPAGMNILTKWLFTVWCNLGKI